MTDRDISSDAVPSGGGFTDGRKVIAVVGIDRYRAWPTLDNAVNDARGALGVFRQLGFEQFVAPLIDETATGDAIRRLVTDDLATLRSDDSLVLFFAGHGHTQTRTLQSGPVQTGFLIPVDGDRPEGRTASWLRLDTWLSDVARLPARHILVILDACHSGLVLGSLIKWRGTGDAPQGNSLDALRGRQSRRVITSALGDQRAMDGGPIAGHSLFTGCLIESLTGGLAQDGRREATGSQIGIYVQQYVASYTQSRQTPDFGALELDDRGELVVPIATAAQPPRPIPDPALDADLVNRRRTAIRDGSTGLRMRQDALDAWRQPTTKAPEGHAPVMRPEGRGDIERVVKPNPIILWVLKLHLFPLWMVMPKTTSAWLQPIAVWLGTRNRWLGVFGFPLLTGMLVPCTTRSRTNGVLWIIVPLLIVIAIVVGRMISAAPAIVRSLSVQLLRRRFLTGSAVAWVLLGAAIGMSERDRLDQVCTSQLVAADALQQANRDGAGAAFAKAAKACEAIGRQDDARRATQAADQVKESEAARQEAERASSFATALSDAQQQPQTAEGAASAVVSYRRALELDKLDKAQSAQFAVRLRALGNAMLAKKDDAAAICAFEEAQLRDPEIDVKAVLASARKALHRDTDALELVEVIDPEIGQTHPEYRDHHGCRVKGGL